jgi:hypothetical protein
MYTIEGLTGFWCQRRSFVQPIILWFTHFFLLNWLWLRFFFFYLKLEMWIVVCTLYMYFFFSPAMKMQYSKGCIYRWSISHYDMSCIVFAIISWDGQSMHQAPVNFGIPQKINWSSHMYIWSWYVLSNISKFLFLFLFDVEAFI